MTQASGGADPNVVLEQLLKEPAEVRLRREMALVTDLVDASFYLSNPTVLESGLDPVEHFCRDGWRELLKPRADFDVWWYWVMHMDCSVESLNPLVHYAVIGRSMGLPTRPESTTPRPGHALASDRPVRRAVLFAGFDADGVVDPSVIEFITDLSRHGDVFYLFDGYLEPSELAKLNAITEGAWAIRHASYDFGSYSRLASTLVGWDRLQEYDEVVLANDSCFLLRPLDEIFSTMAARECDWWGLQATKGIFSTSHQPSNDFTMPIDMAKVRDTLLATYEEDQTYDFHVGSYFLAFRRPVLDDAVFRVLLSSVRRQGSKRLIIKKYEVGLTHLLIGRGFAFDTFIPVLYPSQPVFTESYFELLGRGFPLLKRLFIYRNLYNVPGLAQWKERVLAEVPDAHVELFEQTLLRAAPDDQLRNSLAVIRAEDGGVVVPLVAKRAEYRRLDKATSKRRDWWVFAVDPSTDRLPANSRAIFEAVKDDPAITKIILTRARRLQLEGNNVVVEPLLSPAGRDRLLGSGVVLVSENGRRTLNAPVLSKHQTIVMVREGLLLEKSGRAAGPVVEPPGVRSAKGRPPLVHPLPHDAVSGLLVASEIDQLAALASHWPASFEHAWSTGIPAHDFLLGAEERLPADLRVQMSAVRDELEGRRLLLFAPTLRSSGTARGPYPFTCSEIDAIVAWCNRHDFVLGLRESEHDLERAYSVMFGPAVLDLSPRRYPSHHAVLRVADALLTDYSGTALDFAITGRPVVSFAHDVDIAQERLFYDVDHFFPGPVAHTFDELEASLDTVIDGHRDPRYDRVREMLVDQPDGHATERVIEQLMTSDAGMA